MDEINKIFKTRDQAILKKDKELFLSTQIGEIRDSSSDGYLSIGKMVTEVLAVEKINEITKMVSVKETYYVKSKKSHSILLIYYLVNTVRGWKIYGIIY